MSAADDFASLKQPPTAQDVVGIFARNGLALTAENGEVVVPAGITSGMADLVEKHRTEIVALLTKPASSPEPVPVSAPEKEAE